MVMLAATLLTFFSPGSVLVILLKSILSAGGYRPQKSP